MQVRLKIFRYNPETDKKPHFDKFTVEAEPIDRVLDLLEWIKDYEDGTLSSGDRVLTEFVAQMPCASTASTA